MLEKGVSEVIGTKNLIWIFYFVIDVYLKFILKF